MSNRDQLKLEQSLPVRLNDLQLLLDFHGEMQNKGMVSILLSRITKLMQKQNA